MANHNSSQTGLMGTYDTNNVYFNADGKEIFGFGADAYFTFAYDNDNVSVAQEGATQQKSPQRRIKSPYPTMRLDVIRRFKPERKDSYPNSVLKGFA